jgi:hypothetical protein
MKREPPDSLVANIVSIGLRNLADTRATSGTLVAYVAVTSAMGHFRLCLPVSGAAA